MSQQAPLTPFPFALPPRFADYFGYCGDRRFVAVYWELLGDEVTVQDDRCSVTGFGDRHLWSDLVG